MIYITIAKLNSQNRTKRGKTITVLACKTGNPSLTFPYYLDRPSKDGRANTGTGTCLVPPCVIRGFLSFFNSSRSRFTL